SDSIPLLVIAPGMPVGHQPGRGELHEVKDQTAAVEAIAGRARRVTTHAAIGTAIAQAFADLGDGRSRPTYVQVPFDLLATDPDEPAVPAAPPIRPRTPDLALVADAARLLSGAQRPGLIVGGGARFAAEQVKAVAERLASPVLATVNGKGVLPEDHHLAV